MMQNNGHLSKAGIARDANGNKGSAANLFSLKNMNSISSSMCVSPLRMITIQQMIFVCIISHVNLKTRPDIAISFGPETWNSPFTFPTCKEENFENIMTVLTTNNLLRRERLQSQERLSAQTVERVPLDVAQTILDLEVGGGHLKDGDDDGD